jgi:hypothetical protein
MTVELLIKDGQAAFGNRPCGSSTNLAAMPLHLANVVIHLGKHVGPVPVASFPRESAVWYRREMRLCERYKDEERFLRLHIALHEADWTLRDFGVNEPTLLHVIHVESAALFALPAFHDLL